MSHRVVVSSFQALVDTPLRDGVNAVCWERTLPGDFAALADAVAPSTGLRELHIDKLWRRPLSRAAQRALQTITEDMDALEALGHAPVLNCLRGYARDDRGLPIATDVMSFHVDRADVETDTYLCTYAGAPSLGLAPADAIRALDVPSIEAALRAYFDAQHEAASGQHAEHRCFEDFVCDEAFDLHFRPAPGATPFSFGTGHLWKLGTRWPGAPVPACIHRAPDMGPSDPPRLLLIC